MTVGFLFVTLLTLYSISPMIGLINSMHLAKWIAGCLYLLAFILWFCGIAFLYHAEIAVFRKKRL